MVHQSLFVLFRYLFTSLVKVLLNFTGSMAYMAYMMDILRYFVHGVQVPIFPILDIIGTSLL